MVFSSEYLLMGLIPFSYEFLDKCAINLTKAFFTADQTIADEENPEGKPWVTFIGGDNRTYIDFTLRSPCENIILAPVRVWYDDFRNRLFKAVTEEENFVAIRVPLEYKDGLTMNDCDKCKFTKSCDFASKVRHFVFKVAYRDEDLFTTLGMYFNSWSYDSLITRIKAFLTDEKQARNLWNIGDSYPRFYVGNAITKEAVEQSEKIAKRIADRNNPVQKKEKLEIETSLEDMVNFLVVKKLFEQGAYYPPATEVFCYNCGKLIPKDAKYCHNCGKERK